MLQRLIDAFFGCTHSRTTFPLTPTKVVGKIPPIRATAVGTYVVCLDCGREFHYDWRSMRVGKPCENFSNGAVVNNEEFIS